MLIRKFARPLLAATFVAEGLDALVHPDERVKAAAELLRHRERRTADGPTAKLTDDPVTVVRVTGAAQLGAGLMLALGRLPRLAASTLALTVIPNTLTQQDFWSETDESRKAAKRAGFLKDVSLLGGLLIAGADTAGKPSLGWRGRQAAASMAASLPGGWSAAGGNDAVRTRLRVAAEHGADVTQAVTRQGTDFAHVAADRGTELAQRAADRGPELARMATERGGEFVQAAGGKASALADAVRERGPEWLATAKVRGIDAAEVARGRGGQVAAAIRRRADDVRGRCDH